MQCITELLCIWPIPGAMSVYVSEFVDVELGIAVGVAYWWVVFCTQSVCSCRADLGRFTYSVSFAALIATTAALFDFWPGVKNNREIDGGIVYFLLPLVLVGVNTFGIQV